MTTPSKTAEAVERLNYIAQRLGEDTFTELLRHYPQATSDARLQAFAHDFRQALQALTDAQQSEARVREERDELQQTFDLQWAADMRAVARWRAAGEGRDLTLPDRACLVVFLLEKLEGAEAAAAAMGDAPMTSEQVRAFALRHAHFAVPVRPGVTLTWTDEETGERLGRVTIKGANVVPFPSEDASLTAPKPEEGENEVLEQNYREATRVALASPAPSRVEPVALDTYDAGLLNDFGGGNVEWWHDYLRAELARAHDFYASQVTSPPDAQPRIEALEKENALLRAAVMGHQKCRDVGLLNMTDDEVAQINDAHKKAVEAARARAALQPGGDHGR